MTKITIVGGGVSGVLLAIQLMKGRPNFPLNITLIEKEKQPWQERCAQLHRKFVHAVHVQPFAPEVHGHHWGKLAETFLAPEIKQSFLELPDLFLPHLACISEAEDERSCQGWPEATAKRLGLDCDEDDVC